MMNIDGRIPTTTWIEGDLAYAMRSRMQPESMSCTKLCLCTLYASSERKGIEEKPILKKRGRSSMLSHNGDIKDKF